MAEEWRSVVGYEGFYEVSDSGLIRRIAPAQGTRPGRVLRMQPSSSGHLYVSLRMNGERRQASVHRTVALAFLGPGAQGLEVCHNNGNPADNRLENLRWDTHRANMQDAVKHGVMGRPSGEACKWGHRWTDENAGRDTDGYKVCRTCAREATRAYRASRKREAA